MFYLNIYELLYTYNTNTVSEWLFFNANSAIFQLSEQVNCPWDDDEVRFVLDQHTKCYSASSLKQQSSDRHVDPLRHIILIPSQPVFTLYPYTCVLNKSTNTNSIVFGLNPSRLEPTIYHIRGEHANQYTIVVVYNTNTCLLSLYKTILM